MRRLARLCIHDEMGAHDFDNEWQGVSDCPGGEFLTEDTLVTVWWCKSNRALRERPGICLSRRVAHPECCWVAILEAGAGQRPTGGDLNGLS